MRFQVECMSMKVVFATGIYPPDIGGPATYVYKLAQALAERKVAVTVITYGEADDLSGKIPVYRASKKGGPIARWRRFAKLMRDHADDADILYCTSSVSCGVPLWLSRVKHPRKILRLGGDFFWERYTDRGGVMGLREWYDARPWLQGVMNGILRHFDHIIFSTAFQEELYEKIFAHLPLHSVIENAVPQGIPVQHEKHDPMTLLYLGRFVSFKNLGSLIVALKDLPDMTLELVGSGPIEQPLRDLVDELDINDRIKFSPAVSGDAKQHLFLDHDLLVIPSYTEISPNTALEARAAGLPVLLTQETGLSRSLSDGAMLRRTITPQDIILALREARDTYELIAQRASANVHPRTWDDLAEEHLHLFRSLL